MAGPWVHGMPEFAMKISRRPFRSRMQVSTAAETASKETTFTWYALPVFHFCQYLSLQIRGTWGDCSGMAYTSLHKPSRCSRPLQ